MVKMCNIYGLVDPLMQEEFRYVGKTPFSIKKRLSGHIEEAERKGEKKVKTYKCNWIRKLLKKNVVPIIILIDTVSMKEWPYWEKYYIKHYKNLGHRLTNATDGGEGIMGYKHTEKTRKSISVGVRDALNEEILLKMSESHKGEKNYMFNKHHIPESLLKMSKIKLGKRCMEETKGKISKGNTGKVRSEESKEKYRRSKSGKNNPMFGKTWEEMYGIEKAKEMRRDASRRCKERISKHPSQETLKLISEALLGNTNRLGKKLNKAV